MSLHEIEKAIAHLSPTDFAALEAWFDMHRNAKWDLQIEEDVESEKLQSVYQLLLKEDKGKPRISLDTFLDDQKLS